MLLSEAFSLYRRDVITFRNQSRRTEECHVTCLSSLLKFAGDLEIVDLDFSAVRDWKSSMEARGLSISTIRNYLINLRVVLLYLLKSGVACLDPDLIQLPKRIYKPPSVVTAAEVQKLIDAVLVKRNGYPMISRYKNAAIISLIYSCGLRVSELCSLDTRTVRGDTFAITGKGGKTRPSFIDPRTRLLLNQYLALRTDSNPALFICRNDNGRMTPGNIQFIFQVAKRKAGFDFPVHPHTLRHAFATNLLKNGCHIYVLSRLMGHASIQTTAMYLHMQDPELEEAHQKYHTV